MATPSVPGGIELAPGVFAAETGVRLQYARGSGPGGQNVNKLNTKAELWVALDALNGLTPGARSRLAAAAGSRLTLAGEIHLASDEHRTQAANRAAVFERLRELIVTAKVEPKRRKKTKPSRAYHRRRVEGKRRRGEVKSNRRTAGD